MRKALFQKLSVGASAIFGDVPEPSKPSASEVEDRFSQELTLFKASMAHVDERFAKKFEQLTMANTTVLSKRKEQKRTLEEVHVAMENIVTHLTTMPFTELYRLMVLLDDVQFHKAKDIKGFDNESWKQIWTKIKANHNCDLSELNGMFERLHTQAKDVFRSMTLKIIRESLESDPKRFLAVVRDHAGAKIPQLYNSVLEPSFRKPTVPITNIDQKRVLLEHGAHAKTILGSVAEMGGDESEEFSRKFRALVSQYAVLPEGLPNDDAFDLRHQSEIRHATDLILFGVLWAEQGFPQITLGHKLAASIMATEISLDLLPELQMIWPTFVIAVPEGLVPNVQYVAITKRESEHESSIHFLCGVKKTLMIDERGKTIEGVPYGWTAGWKLPNLAALAAPIEPFAHKKEDAESSRFHFNGKDHKEIDRKTEMIQRLVLGVLLELQAHNDRGTLPQRPLAARKDVGRDAVPIMFTFTLRREVKVDARPYVAAYLAGEGNSPAVQLLVRGHSRRQVCGKGRLGRKIMWIEPYWRGPFDAPIAVRAHHLERGF